MISMYTNTRHKLFVQVNEISDADFFEEMGFGSEDSALELTQLSEITTNIYCQQVWKKDLGPFHEIYVFSFIPYYA
jgi:hypothetical protein